MARRDSTRTSVSFVRQVRFAAMPRSKATHPPKPRFTLAVGIIGHRPNRLPEETRPRIASEITEVLTSIRDEAFSAYQRHANCFARTPPRLVLITSLAEGSDCVAAKAAAELGFELQAPLPFPVCEYEKDFAEDEAKRSFQALVGRARVILELGGSRAHEGKSYAAAGLVVLDMSDIIIGVWDGGAVHGRGGTTELIAEAARRGMPVVRIGTESSSPPQLHWRALADRHMTPIRFEDHPAAALDLSLAAAVEAAVRPPLDPAEECSLGQYFTEYQTRFTPRVEFPLLMLLLGVVWPSKSDVLLPQPDALAHEMRESGSAPLPGARELRRHAPTCAAPRRCW